MISYGFLVRVLMKARFMKEINRDLEHPFTKISKKKDRFQNKFFFNFSLFLIIWSREI